MKVAVVGALVTASLWAQAPIIEYGSPEELKGLTKLYIYTGTDIEVQQNVAKQIRQRLPEIQISDKPEDAEMVFLVSGSTSSFFAGMHSNSTSIGQTTTTNTTPIYSNVILGTGTIFKPMGPNRLRLLVQFNESRKTIFERRPSTNIARDFVEAYKKANGKKK
jgi:hypothetical protein